MGGRDNHGSCILFGLFILLLMLSVPIGYAIGMVTLVTMLHFTSMPTLMIAQNSIAGVDSFPLLAIPFLCSLVT